MAKPVPAEELAFAIRALGRRLKPAPADVQISLLDRYTRNLVFPGGELTLTPDEATLLKALALAENQCMESWQLLELLSREVSEQGKKQLEVLFSRLRSKLKARGMEQPIIQAERGIGYRLCLPLRLV
ncbi:hypothetical protein CCR91_02230 [Thiorhodovibrio winogradskyi]|nr:hypothetical protein [Thiorhodovibrio winogradskyi]